MENSTTPPSPSSAPRADRPNACPPWCTEHLDAGPQRPGVAETWHSTRVGGLWLSRPTGCNEPREIAVEAQTLVTDDLLELTSSRGETSVTVLLLNPGIEVLELHSAAECYRLAALLMQAGDDLSNVAPGQLEPRAVA